MSFKENLLQRASTVEAAFLRYITTENTGEFTKFAFVEDLDDVDFYQHVLQDIDDIYFVRCGGRDGVLTLYARIGQKHSNKHRLLFFVDKDSWHREQLPSDVCSTCVYSWESHVGFNDVIQTFIRRKTVPQANEHQAAVALEQWERTIGHFEPVLKLQYQLIHVSAEFNLKLGAGNIPLVRNCLPDEHCVRPSNCREAELKAVLDSIEFSDEIRNEWEYAEAVFNEIGAVACAHGRNLFAIFRKCMENVLQIFGVTTRVNLGSAREFLLSIPYRLGCFEYIREYAHVRLN